MTIGRTGSRREAPRALEHEASRAGAGGERHWRGRSTRRNAGERPPKRRGWGVQSAQDSNPPRRGPTISATHSRLRILGRQKGSRLEGGWCIRIAVGPGGLASGRAGQASFGRTLGALARSRVEATARPQVLARWHERPVPAIARIGEGRAPGLRDRRGARDQVTAPRQGSSSPRSGQRRASGPSDESPGSARHPPG